MKIALCLHGLVGSIKGKNQDLLGGSDKVLDISSTHNHKFIIDKNTDVFVHSWSTELEKQIIDIYSPKNHLIEEQIEFNVPDYIKSKESRGFSHLSRWYSYKEVLKLKSSYENLKGFKYDFVLVQRFDLCWNISPAFHDFDSSKLYVGKSALNPNKEWSDRWFIANSNNSDKFGSLYDEIPSYMGPGGSLPSNLQYAGISSHFLTRHHAIKLNLDPVFLYNFGGYGVKPDDYNEVRRMYYGDK